MSVLTVLCALSFAAWCVLVFAHGRFWLGDQRLDGRAPPPPAWPAVVAVVPARDEAALLPETLGSLLDQDYPGELRIVLADDESSDGTAAVAERMAREHRHGARLRVVATKPRPTGWVGKMWAVESGVRAAADAGAAPAFWLFTDADIAHRPDSLRRLVAKAEVERLDLVSQMVLLHAGGGWGGLLVPAFVYFFQKLYPFPLVNDPHSRTAAAAGGCALVRRAALARAGGIEALRGEVIDDCALGRAVKRGGPIWLGLSTGERSVRPYAGIGDVWRMVARSAYTQLHYSPLLLAGCVAGLALLYLVPPLAALAWPLHGQGAAGALGVAAWALLAASFVPTLALYGRAPVWGLALPIAGLLYAAMTIDSARRHHRADGANCEEEETMPRLRQVPRAEAPADIQTVYDMLFGGRCPVAEPGTATGTPGNWWTVFALVPDCFRHAVAGFAFYRSPKRKLDPQLRELGQLRAGFVRESQFVFSQHCKAARDVGLSDEKIEAVPSWSGTDVFSPTERAVLAYVDELVLQNGRVQDATFERLRAQLGEEEILELTYVTALYEMHAIMSRALRLEYDDVPERIVEVAAPSGARGLDFMSGVGTDE